MNISLSAFAILSRVSLLISILRLNLVLTYGIPPESRGGVCTIKRIKCVTANTFH